MREKLIELLRSVQYQGNAVHGYHDKYIQNSELADHLIANGVTIQRWIPVSEPPKEDGKYMVYMGGHLSRGIYTLDFAKDARKIDRFEFRCRWKNVWYGHDSEWGYFEVGSVTHWMPLPLPPKEGE